MKKKIKDTSKEQEKIMSKTYSGEKIKSAVRLLNELFYDNLSDVSCYTKDEIGNLYYGALKTAFGNNQFYKEGIKLIPKPKHPKVMLPLDEEECGLLMEMINTAIGFYQLQYGTHVDIKEEKRLAKKIDKFVEFMEENFW